MTVVENKWLEGAYAPIAGDVTATELEVIGTLPTELEDRARLVLERQLAVAHRITQRLTATGRERALHQRLRDTASPDVPLYLDIDA